MEWEKTLHRKMARELALRILRGEYGPESRLPNEEHLLKEFEVSRTVLREAIKTLQAKGLVSVRQKLGATVRASDQWHLFDEDILRWQSEVTPLGEVLSEMLEIRWMIEPMAAALAAERADPEAVGTLLQCVERMSVERLHTPEGQEADLLFHQTIMKSSGNRFVVAMEPVISRALEILFRVTSINPEASEQAQPYHEQIAESIASQNPESAREAYYQLLQHSAAHKDEFLQILGSSPGLPQDLPEGSGNFRGALPPLLQSKIGG